MAECEKTVVSLKEALVMGAVLDFVLFAISSIIMDGGTMASITLLIVIAHWMLNAAVLCSKELRNSAAGRDFIRFGFFLIMIATAGACLVLSYLGFY